MSNDVTRATLRRQLGVLGAVFMGLGAMVGTGVFVSIGIAAGAAGPAVILAIMLAAIVAVCNALSSAQLAAAYPVSGGTYEYGYRLLLPPLAFTAGWLFLCAKTASAATAALGFTGYFLNVLSPGNLAPAFITLSTILVLTIVAVLGLRGANGLNIGIVSVTLLALLAFVVAGLPHAWERGGANLQPFFAPAPGEGRSPIAGLLEGAALMFVAFTGYGRIATMGEEIRDPERTIPRAIIITMAVCAVLYIAVALVAVAVAGATALSQAAQYTAAPLEIIARGFEWRAARWIVTIGAMTAMLGVLLNLILGLSRVLLAMGRRGDGPPVLARLNRARTTPPVAVVVVGVAIALLAMSATVRLTWSFSAFTVLIYYAITNLAALRLPRESRRYSRGIAWTGLVACLLLAFWVPWRVWVIGLAMILLGFVWRAFARRLWTGATTP